MKQQAYWHFRVSAALCLTLACIAGLFISVYGKNGSFLLINGLNSPSGDLFFRYFTHLGDGLIWLPLLAYVFFYKRDFLVTLLVAFAVCTLLTQFCKWVIFADALRPFGALKDQVRKVPGVDTHSTSSFPSGHTSIAFTYAMLMAYLVERRIATMIFPLIAFFVGYSRVYLAQHFVTDVLAGIIVGMASAFLALLFYQRWKERQKRKTENAEQDQETGIKDDLLEREQGSVLSNHD